MFRQYICVQLGLAVRFRCQKLPQGRSPICQPKSKHSDCLLWQIVWPTHTHTRVQLDTKLNIHINPYTHWPGVYLSKVFPNLMSLDMVQIAIAAYVNLSQTTDETTWENHHRSVLRQSEGDVSFSDVLCHPWPDFEWLAQLSWTVETDVPLHSTQDLLHI